MTVRQSASFRVRVTSRYAIWSQTFNNSLPRRLDSTDRKKWSIKYCTSHLLISNCPWCALTVRIVCLWLYNKVLLVNDELTSWFDDANLSTEIFNLPPPPHIVAAYSENCGRCIYVVWISQYTWHELQLNSTSDRGRVIHREGQNISYIHVFHGLKSNTVYEIRIRARNSSRFDLWAKKQIKTIAGKVMLYDPWLLQNWTMFRPLETICRLEMFITLLFNGR